MAATGTSAVAAVVVSGSAMAPPRRASKPRPKRAFFSVIRLFLLEWAVDRSTGRHVTSAARPGKGEPVVPRGTSVTMGPTDPRGTRGDKFPTCPLTSGQVGNLSPRLVGQLEARIALDDVVRADIRQSIGMS